LGLPGRYRSTPEFAAYLKRKMKLAEALIAVKRAQQRDGEVFTCFLATGFTPLHLISFLGAELAQSFPEQKIAVQQGLYGDLPGNVNRLAKSGGDAGAVLIEWADLDARLGIRSSAAWSPSIHADIVKTVAAQTLQIQRAIEEASGKMPVIVSFPTLPLPPISYVSGYQTSAFETDLTSTLHSLRSHLSQNDRVRILSAQRLEMLSPLSERHDVESELSAGFPYKLAHASVLANLIALLIRKPVPKKGLITDLDDTVWRGILGEVGIDGVSWDLDHHSQMHAFYQKLLGSLAAEGVLIAIASKNEKSFVETALARKDLAVPSNIFFPLEVSWRPKSEAVGRILKTWNIGADAVVFIDDSPLELAEVKASHPGVECIQFPTKDAAAIYRLCWLLRDLFGKSAIMEEDAIRAQSIRRAHEAASGAESTGSQPPGFLDDLDAQTTFHLDKVPVDPRAFELVNKTNQFNLNGKRYTESSWQNYLQDPSSVLLVASYTDKFGPLGKIAVLAGKQDGKKLVVDTWVMSCRAFSRRIESLTLEELFAKCAVDEIEFDFVKTERNSPLREFLAELLGAEPSGRCVVSRRTLASRSRLTREPQEIANG
jgi:FkbH-like protein